MSTRPSIIRAALLACAFALAVGVVLGCSDEEEAGDLLGPAATLTPISPGDLPADLSTTMDTAYVAPVAADDLVGAVVNEDGSITKGDAYIGSVTALGSVGSTSTTRVSGTDGESDPPGNASGSRSAVMDEGAPSNPNGPQFDVWCMVRIWYYTDTGEILRVEILFCWDDESGGGGNNNNNNQEQVTFSLSCDASVTRGRYGGCRVDASTDEGEIDTEHFSFSWSSSLGASASGTGMDEWRGSAVEDVTVTVSVNGYSASEDITVRARSNWRFQAVRAGWIYNASLSALGQYDLPSTPSRVSSATEGGGPWEDRYYMDRAPSPNTEIWINVDYSTYGPRYPGARGTCPPRSNSLTAAANYYRVNDACQTLLAMNSFRRDIISHEREHEDGINDCLTRSPKGRAAARRIEAVTGGSRGAVTSAAQALWDTFHNGPLQNSGFRASAYSGGSAFHFNSAGSWYNGYPGIRGHPGQQHSCP